MKELPELNNFKGLTICIYSFKAKFSADLFGQQSINDNRLEPAPVEDPGGLGFKTECAFGECEMISNLADEKLTFRFPLQLLAKKLQVANVVVLTNVFLGQVTFSCEYPTVINVSSDFKSHVIDATMKGRGDLTQGFK